MTVRFRVISELTGNDLTDRERWLLDPNGKLFYKRGDSLYEDESLKIVFDIDVPEKTGKWLFPKYALEPDKLENIDTLIINGYKYVKEK